MLYNGLDHQSLKEESNKIQEGDKGVDFELTGCNRSKIAFNSAKTWKLG